MHYYTDILNHLQDINRSLSQQMRSPENIKLEELRAPVSIDHFEKGHPVAAPLCELHDLIQLKYQAERLSLTCTIRMGELASTLKPSIKPKKYTKGLDQSLWMTPQSVQHYITTFETYEEFSRVLAPNEADSISNRFESQYIRNRLYTKGEIIKMKNAALMHLLDHSK